MAVSHSVSECQSDESAKFATFSQSRLPWQRPLRYRKERSRSIIYRYGVVNGNARKLFDVVPIRTATASAVLPVPSLQWYGPWMPLVGFDRTRMLQSLVLELVTLRRDGSVAVHGIVVTEAPSYRHVMVLMPADASVEHSMLTSLLTSKITLLGDLVSSDRAPATRARPAICPVH